MEPASSPRIEYNPGKFSVARDIFLKPVEVLGIVCSNDRARLDLNFEVVPQSSLSISKSISRFFAVTVMKETVFSSMGRSLGRFILLNMKVSISLPERSVSGGVFRNAQWLHLIWTFPSLSNHALVSTISESGSVHDYYVVPISKINLSSLKNRQGVLRFRESRRRVTYCLDVRRFRDQGLPTARG